jgi:hypothetical protein
MKTTHAVKAAGLCLFAGVLAGAVNPASAMEGLSPYMPGVSVGSAAGALPPPGEYFANDNVFLDGGVKNNSGNDVPVNVWLDVDIPSVLYVPNFQVLGATFAMAAVQPYVFKGVDATGAGGRATLSNGLFNTIISPINLSWNLGNGFFVGGGLGIYIDDGYTVHQPGTTKLGTAGTVVGQPNIANDFWTFEPGVAVSWLQNGWNLTLHAVVDINTTNSSTNYYSGDTFYLDYTVAKTIGKWTFGGGGNFTQQWENDTQNGHSVANSEIQHVLLGPLVGYEFGPVNISAKAMFGVSAQNDANVSFYHLSFAFPF